MKSTESVDKLACPGQTAGDRGSAIMLKVDPMPVLRYLSSNATSDGMGRSKGVKQGAQRHDLVGLSAEFDAKRFARRQHRSKADGCCCCCY